jgi:hypothetical protein
MNPYISIEEHLEMETQVQPALTETDILAQCGFSAEEIVPLLWLRTSFPQEAENPPALGGGGPCSLEALYAANHGTPRRAKTSGMAILLLL